MRTQTFNFKIRKDLRRRFMQQVRQLRRQEHIVGKNMRVVERDDGIIVVRHVNDQTLLLIDDILDGYRGEYADAWSSTRAIHIMLKENHNEI